MKILFIITGSIAAFKSLELIRMLRKNLSAEITPVLSSGGELFVTPLSVSALSEKEVLTKDTYKMEHINVSRETDLILICPAGASFLNKIANGVGGDIALDLMLARLPSTPVVVAPAMNVQMWLNDTTKTSVSKLKDQGFYFIEPVSGELLCGENGEGKLEEVNIIYDKVLEYYNNLSKFKGKKVLITLGGTIERIDDVRYISNFSSGTQGAFIIKEFLLKGAEVTAVVGNVNSDVMKGLPSRNLHIIKIESALEMNEVVEVQIENNNFDYFFSVAAVGDFKVKNKTNGKLKKENGVIKIELEVNPDILSNVSSSPKRPNFIFGFAVEEKQNMMQNGHLKLKKKGCDAIFVNDFHFGEKNTSGFIITKKDSIPFEGSKSELAKKLCELAANFV
jgi:phosphopantothenoylcysteine decarboxylase/phosphopantothenate--cysteine ligase